MKRVAFILLSIMFSLVLSQAEKRIESWEDGTSDCKISWKDELFISDRHDASVKQMLETLARLNGSKIIVNENVTGTIIHNFSGTLKDAWDVLIEKEKLNCKVVNGIIYVDANKLEKKILVLEYLNADKLKKLLDNYGIIDRSVDRLEFGKGMDNTVYIEGTTSVIKELEALILQLEKAEQLRQEEIRKKDEIELKKREEEARRKKEELEKQRFELQQRNAKLEEERIKQELEQKEIMFQERLNELNKKMMIDVIPLKYINVSESEMEFQGQKIKIESLEDTLKGLIGTNYADKNSTIGYIPQAEIAFLKVDQRTNSVIIKDFPERIEEIRKILKDPVIGLDKRPMLVEIEVTIAIGNSGFTEELGIKLGGSREDGDAVYGVSSAGNIADNLNELRRTATTTRITTDVNGETTTEEVRNTLNTSLEAVDLLQPVGALGLSSSMIYMGGKTILNMQLNAMEEEGLGKVLSNPRIITLNNREATILSGNSVSIPVATVDKMGLETVDTGISIKTKPHIILENDDKKEDYDILLDISIEKSSLGAVSTEKIEKATSKIESTLMIKNEQTLILGGLFQYTKTSSEGGIPFLKDIPLIGLFFQTKNNNLMKNELLFFITPRVITSEIIEKRQDHSYMSYKKNLEFHKANLTQKLNDVDDVGAKEEEKEEKKEEKIEEEDKAEKKLTPLEIFEEYAQEEEDY